jgi:hypothetical protein
MNRNYWLLTAAGLAVGFAGCTHCDTCDDFPVPYFNQTMAYGGGPGSYIMGDAAPVVTEPATTTAPAPGGSNTTAPANANPNPAGPPPSNTGSPHSSATSLESIPDADPSSPPAPAATLGGLPRTPR